MKESNIDNCGGNGHKGRGVDERLEKRRAEMRIERRTQGGATCRRRRRLRCRPREERRPFPFMLLLLIELTTKTTTLLFLPRSPILFASSQSIQGYVYWDRNGDGLLERGGTVGGGRPSELENGLIDVLVEVRPCDDDIGHGSDDRGKNVVVAKAMTLWPPNRPDEKREEGHSAIYPYGGYYKLNLGGKDEDGCTLNVDQLLLLRELNGTKSSTAVGSEAGAAGMGCYLTVIAPADYEITSSFPAVNSFDPNNNANVEPSAFGWIPHDDNRHGARYARGWGGLEGVNRGYRARTARCFGYSSNDRAWYVWSSNHVASNGNGNDDGSGDNDNANENNLDLQRIARPNDGEYGYDAYLPAQEAYDRTLSISPAGMVRSTWPLSLRVRGTLALGLEFVEGDDNDDMDGSEISGNDEQKIESSPADDPVGGKPLPSESSRFEFRRTDAKSIRAYLAEETLQEGIQSYNNDNGLEGKRSNDTSVNYRHTNLRGMLTNTRVLEATLRNFLGEKLLERNIEGMELAFVDVSVVDQWSMVEVVDGGETSTSTGVARSSKHGIDGARLDSRSLRGESFLPMTEASDAAGVTVSNLRGSVIDPPSSLRRLASLPNPHLVFELRLTGKYDGSSSSLLTSNPQEDPSKDPDVEEAAVRTSSNFATRASDTINAYRDEVTTRMRRRSGYGQECNPVMDAVPSSSASPLAGYNPVYISNEDSEYEEYTEIEIGVVNRFDCDKLLPLYYHELEALAVRVVDDAVGNVGSIDGGKGRLDAAIASLAIDDGIDGLPSITGPRTNENSGGGGGTPSWLAIIAAIACALAVLAIAAGLYIRRERRKLAAERERRKNARLEREEKRKSRSLKGGKKKKKKKKKGGEEDDDYDGGPSPIDIEDGQVASAGGRQKMVAEDRKCSAMYDSDDSELDRLFTAGGIGGGEESTAPSRGGTTVSSSRGSKATGGTKEKKKRRRKKKRTQGGSSEASKTSGMTRSRPSKDNLSAMISSMAEDAARSGDGGGHIGKVGDDGDDNGQEKCPSDEEDMEHSPPRRIKLSNRDKMEKGISDLSVRLAASLRRSANHTALSSSLVRTSNHNALEDVEEGGGPHRAAKEKASKKKKTSKPAGGGDGTGGEGNDRVATVAEADSAPRRRRRRTLEKFASSFRGIIDKDDDGERDPAEKGKAKGKKKRVSINAAVVPKREMSRAMSSMRLSLKKNFIGELSSSSDSSSSSSSSSDDDDDSDGSSSDSDSDDSSSSSDDNYAKPNSKRKQQQQRIPAGYTMGEAQQQRKGHTNHHNHEQDNHSHNNPGFHQQPQEPRREGSNRNLIQGDNPELHGSELTMTNNYLPQHSRDLSPKQRPGLPPKQSSGRGMDASNRSAGSRNSPRGMNVSDRSMGSRTRSSKSSGDFNSSHQSGLHKRGSSRGGSDFNSSHHSFHKGSSKGSMRGSNKGSVGGINAKESKDESDGRGSGDHNNHNDGAKRKSKSRRHANDNNDHRGHHRHRQNHGQKKEDAGGRRTPRSLAQFKSSLTSSMSSLTRGKSLSDIAAQALEEPPLPGDSGIEANERRSGRGSNKGSERGSNRGGDRRSKSGPNRGKGDGEERKKKPKSTSKDKTRPSQESNVKKHSSKHKSRGGHTSSAATDTAAKKNKRKMATAI